MEPTLCIRDYGNGLTEDAVFSVYTQYGASTKRDSNAAVGMLGIGCLRKGQPIVTIDGTKQVEEIQVGDLVLTHKGRFRRVTEIMQRLYEGEAFEVYLSQARTPLVLTAEHPILVGDAEGNTEWELPGEIQTGYRSMKKGIKAWNSYAVLPAVLETDVSFLQVQQILGADYVFENGICTKHTFFRNSKNGIPHKVDSERTSQWPEIPELLELDAELGWFLGLYAAEGSATAKQVTLSLNLHEMDLADRFADIAFRRLGIVFTKYERPDKQILELVAHHLALATLLGNLCGRGSANKKVPEAIMRGPNDARRSFLRGVFDGDGSSSRDRFVFGVASPCLAWGVRTLMAVTEDKWGSVGWMEEYERWSIHYKRNTEWGYSFREGDNLYRPIERINSIWLKEPVYNFSVEEDESYVSNFVLHNCKSAFAYSDAFTVTSWHAGMKKIYTAVLDETNIGQMAKEWEEPTDETGVEIKVPVDPKDVEEFWKEATQLFTWFDVRPDVNMSLAYPQFQEHFRSDAGVIFFKAPSSAMYGGWLAKMGCVAYRLNWERVAARPDFEQYKALIEKMRHGCLFFDIGEVDISANREELEYTERTKAAIVQKLGSLNDLIASQALAKLTSLENGWLRRLEVKNLQEHLPFGIPEQYSTYGRREVPLYTVSRNEDAASPDFGTSVRSVATFTLRVLEWTNTQISGRTKKVSTLKETQVLPVASTTSLVILDNPKIRLGRYNLDNKTMRIVCPTEGSSLLAVATELQDALMKAGLDGVTIRNLSDLPMTAESKRATRPHYKHQLFLWNGEREGGRASDNWELVEEMPEDGVFVVISGFVPLPDKDKTISMAEMVRFQSCVTQLLGETPTEIYGLKTTLKKPVETDKVVGIPYLIWREETLKRILALPNLEHDLQLQRFAQEHGRFGDILREALQIPNKSGERDEDGKEVVAGDDPLGDLDKTLPESHPIMQFFGKCLDAQRVHHSVDSALGIVEEYIPWVDPLTEIYEAYPLMRWKDKYGREYGDGIGGLLKGRRRAYLDYVVALDKLNGG